MERRSRTSGRALVVGTILGAVLAAGVHGPARAADPWVVDGAQRTPGQVRATWLDLRPTHADSPYASDPLLTAPFGAGSLADGFTADGLNSLNFARTLAGLPSDVTIDADKQADAQRAAVLREVVGLGEAVPSRPDGMDETFYSRGLAVAQASNVARGVSSLERANRNFLDDLGSLGDLGHRRWMLNPALQKTAFGYAGSTSVSWIIDSSRAQPIEYDMVAYPGPGAFPREYLVPPGRTDAVVPWHLSLNPARYDWDPTGHQITLRRVSDGQVWTFDASDDDPSAAEYFRADFSGYGVANAFIFRPDAAAVGLQAGDAYDVTLSGGIFEKGTRTPASVTYRTRIMELQPFTDAGPDVQFFEEMAWMADLVISTGWEQKDGSKQYQPVSSVNRDAMAAFLYRFSGSPEFTAPTTSPFLDLSPSDQFYKEITWLASTGISRGWEVEGGWEFRPVTPINRDAMAAFLYRLAGEPTFTPIRQTFADVEPGVQFRTEMEWLAETEISRGWDVGQRREFRPLNAINRDAMAAFLHRFQTNIGTPTP